MSTHGLEYESRGVDTTPLFSYGQVLEQTPARETEAAAAPSKRPKPLWWLLYAALPLTILLFTIADLVPAASEWRVPAELVAALGVMGAIALWVRVNRAALILLDQPGQSGNPRTTF